MAPINTDARRTLSFSPALANWQTGRELEYLKQEALMFRDKPDLADIRTRWQADPKSVSEDDKMRLLEAQHKLHAAAYGYAPGGLHKLAQFNAVAVAQDLKFGNTVGLITLNPGSLGTMAYAEIRTLILHESDHVAQQSWVHAVDTLPENDPRRDFVRRFAAFEMFTPVGNAVSPYGGLSVEGMIIYFAKPGETHAYLLHDPSHRLPAGAAPQPPSAEPITQKPTCLPSLCS